MRKLISFMVVTLDGYYEGPNGEFDWPNIDEEFNEFSVSQLNDIDTLLFGRVTYEGMASYWPTPEASEYDSAIAHTMNTIPKIVFSATLGSADWQNSRLVSGNAADAISELKQQPGKLLAIFGSPTLTVSFLEQRLVDELRVMVHPILLGTGKSLFTGLKDRVPLTLQTTTTFSSGNILLSYRPRQRVTGEPHMSRRKDVVEAYFDGFRRSDHEQILRCLTDDVVWDLPGYKHLSGKDAFDQEIENDEFVGSPTLTVDRLIEEDDTVVAIGNGEASRKNGERHRFAYCDVFTFAAGRIGRVESYLVPLN